MADWNKIKAEYIAGGTSYRKLADAHGVPRTTLERKAKKEKWVDLQIQAGGIIEAKMVDAISDEVAKKAVNINGVADELLERIQTMVADKEIVLSPTGLKDLASAIKILREVKGEKSADDKREQDARIKALEARVSIKDTEDEETGVVALPAIMEVSDG